MSNKIYFAASDGRLKIGISRDVAARLNIVGAHLPSPLVLIGTIEGSYKLERAIHQRLSDFRLRGEWFADVPAVRDVIDALLSSGPAAIGFELVEPASRAARVVSPLVTSGPVLLAKKFWPRATAEKLATITGEAERICARWLRGRVLPGHDATCAIVKAMRAEYDRHDQMLRSVGV